MCAYPPAKFTVTLGADVGVPLRYQFNVNSWAFLLPSCTESDIIYEMAIEIVNTMSDSFSLSYGVTLLDTASRCVVLKLCFE